MILLKCQQQPGLKNFTTKKKKTTLHKYNGVARLNLTLEQIQFLLLLFFN